MKTEYYPTYTGTAEFKAWYISESVFNCDAPVKNRRHHGIIKAIAEWLRIPRNLGRVVKNPCER